MGQYVSRESSRPFAAGSHFSASERIDDGKHFTAPVGGKHQQCVGVSQRFRGKHFTALAGEASTYCRRFTALSREAFLSVVVGGKHQRMLAFLSAFAGSISQRRCGREASAHAGKNVFVFVFVLCLCLCLCW